MNDDDLKRFSQVLDEKLASTELRIVSEIGKFMEDKILEPLDEKANKTDIDRVERKMDKFSLKETLHTHLIPLNV